MHVGGLADHAGCESGTAAHALGPSARVRSRVLEGPWRVGEIRETPRVPPRRHGQVQGIGQEDDGLGAGGLRRQATRVLLGEDRVEVAGPQGGQRFVRTDVAERDREVRVLGVQAGDRVRHEGVGRGLERREAHRAGEVVAGGDASAGGLHLAEDRLGVRDEDLRGGRERDAATRGLQERLAHLAGQEAQLLRDRGRAEVERPRDRRERAAMGQLAQEAHAVQVVHGWSPLRRSRALWPSRMIRKHDRYRSDSSYRLMGRRCLA